jgi:lipopolysaccharide export system protein LptC
MATTLEANPAAPLSAERVTMKRVPAQQGQAAGAFLALLLMSLLAIATWWLVKNSSLPEPPQTEPAIDHQPDYEMQGFSAQRYQPDGRLQTELNGTHARHYPDTDTLEIEQAHLRTYNKDGTTTTAIAKRAVAMGDGSEVELFGGVQVQHQALSPQKPVEFRGEYIRALINQERLVSHQPVHIVQGNSRIDASTLAYQHQDGTVLFTGRTRASFESLPRQAPLKTTMPGVLDARPGIEKIAD